MLSAVSKLTVNAMRSVVVVEPKIICLASGYSSSSHMNVPRISSADLDSEQAKRILNHSAKRGMKEVDLLLGTYVRFHLPKMNGDELNQLEALMSHPDPDLFNWITQKTSPPDELQGSVLTALQEHLKTNPAYNTFT